MEFGGGKLGAVNGMTKSGQLEIVSMQSEEIWTGVTYSLSSTMIMEVNILFYFFLFYIFFCYQDLRREAFLTSEGIYNTCYNEAGLAFQTPEALMRDAHFRSVSIYYIRINVQFITEFQCGYMRALSIWAIQKALELSRLEANINKNKEDHVQAISIPKFGDNRHVVK